MIKDKKELKAIIALEKNLYFNNKSDYRFARLTRDMTYYVWKYQLYLRKCEYYHFIHKRIAYLYYRRKKNKLGVRIGVEIWPDSFETGLKIEHPGGIVVNGNARIGKNCVLFGNNCVGNNGKTLEAPTIGENVRIGVGAKILGGINIANNVFIAAGSVVVDSIEETNVLVAGVPAKIIRRNYE